MKSQKSSRCCLILLALFNCFASHNCVYTRPGATAASVLRARGFLAESHQVATSGGHLLGLFRGRNPLLSEEQLREPILFLHGSGASATIWLAQALAESRPKDLTKLNLNETSLEELREILREEPTLNSLPLLALNCGHEVWLLSRRGKPDSLGTHGDQSTPTPAQVASAGEPDSYKDTLSSASKHVAGLISKSNFSEAPPGGLFESLRPILNLPLATVGYGRFAELRAVSANKQFWNYSHDEQISDDLAKTLDYIQSVTQSERKVILVGHSMGAVVALLGLAANQTLADEKVANAILFAPSLNLRKGSKLNCSQEELLPDRVGPSPAPDHVMQTQAEHQILCNSILANREKCIAELDSGAGNSCGQQVISSTGLSSMFQAQSLYEKAQICQNTVYEVPRKLNFSSAEENMRRYNQQVPPAYNLSLVNLENMLLFGGNSDERVPPSALMETSSQLKVAHKLQIVGEGSENVCFNHLGFLLHEQVGRLVYLPVLKHLAAKGGQT